ncbi:MAG: CapA family protein, partial [Clostridia bacterium]|nr:CapA family protein [Clostridia bacterium]
MGRRMTRRQQAIRRRNIFLGSCAGALAALVFLIAIGISSCSKNTDKKPNNVQNTVSAPSKDEPVHEVASATVLNTGDILIHNPVLWGAEQSDGSYDFTSMFSEAASWFKKADLSVINLEVTLGGNDGRSYTGYPAFNTPDCLIDTLKDQGIGLFLTANNHCYDTRLAGMIRTTQVLKQKGMPFIGTRETDTDPTFIVKDVNGVNIGMACYTYETPTPNGAAANPNNKYLNGNAVANQRRDQMTACCDTGHTEDGALVDYTIKKYSDET